MVELGRILSKSAFSLPSISCDVVKHISVEIEEYKHRCLGNSVGNVLFYYVQCHTVRKNA